MEVGTSSTLSGMREAVTWTVSANTGGEGFGCGSPARTVAARVSRATAQGRGGRMEVSKGG